MQRRVHEMLVNTNIVLLFVDIHPLIMDSLYPNRSNDFIDLDT
jgi:hypothetical protein